MHNPLTTRIASIVIGLVLGVLLIVGGFRLFQNTFSRAGDEAPRDVIVSEISQNGAKVVWSTGQENQGVVEYGTSPTALNFFAPEGQKTLSHSVDLTLLSPATTYYFQIRIADQKYDNGGVPWTFTTKGTDTTQVPTATPTSATQPTPIQSLEVPAPDVPTAAPTTAALTCDETDCEKIKAKLGKGCNTSDYIKCTSN